MIKLILLTFGLAAIQAEAQDRLAPIQIIGSEAQELNKPNSSHYLSKDKLERQQDTDINRVLKQVPGVYVREEEGYGLRPNIGLRGTNPDRSKKINFMEDGVLIGPAPYSAPAAYYTPSMFHVESMEVFKGVATVPFGPNSVGGSINMLTPAIGKGGFLEGSLGNFDYRKVIGRVGHQGEVYSLLFQGAYHETSGFKELPDDANTGFEQSDFLLKSRIRLRGGDRPQFLDLKAGYAREDSRETYLGLSLDDFQKTPYRRYSASQLDEMRWNHQTYQASYTAAVSESSTLMAMAYANFFERNWYRLDRFATAAVTLREVLEDPDANPDYMAILRGEADSTIIAGGELDVRRNQRVFFSRGVQLHHMYSGGRHELHWGLRYHEDQIQRNHGIDRYGMTDGVMIRNADPRVNAEVDQDTARSVSLFAKDEITLGSRWRLTAATRLERVETTARNSVIDDVQVNTETKNHDVFVVPGLGALYSITPSASIFAGINRGYAPVGPGQSDGVEPEESLNHELGFRYLKEFFAEAIVFYNDYGNIKGLCSFSAGCTAGNDGQEFSGGKAIISGLESRLRYAFQSGTYTFPLELNYTYTSARFASDFQTTSAEWGPGQIRSGDPLPFVPEHQYTFSTGLWKGRVTSDLRFNWTGRQYNSSAAGRKQIDAFGVVDLNVKYETAKNSFVYFKIDNLLDNEYLVSFRPYGARPGKDRLMMLGYRQGF